MSWQYITSMEHIQLVAISVAIFLFFLLLRKLFTKYLFALFIKLSKKMRSSFVATLLQAFERPFQWFFIIVGIYAALYYYPYVNHVNETFIQLLRAFIIFLITWGLLNVASKSSHLFETIDKKTSIEIDEILIPFLSRALQVIIIAISISVILQEFNYNIGGFITGLGLGGLAFSLAAQDALSNLFGGIVIITEKPFTIDDWIETPSVEGVVEDISFRSTRVRTFAQALVTVPNATLANEPITNWSKMGKRQITFSFMLMYDTPTTIVENAVTKIDEAVRTHPEVHQETIYVKVNNLTDQGIEIMLNFFTASTEYDPYIHTREELNLRILDILKEEGAEVATPMRNFQTEQQ